MKLVSMLKTTPLWLLLPLLMFVGVTAFAVSGYEPLVFDAGLYDIETAQAVELGTVDAAAIEAENAQPVETEPLASMDDTLALTDGSWTGYAPCGEGNPDGWKPYYVAVTIQVVDGKVASLSKIAGTSTGNAGDARLNWDAAENQRYLDEAVQGSRGVKAQIEAALAAGSTTASIDAVSGATYSSVSVYNAYADAVNKASGGKSAVATQAAPKASEDAPKAPKKTKAPAASKEIDALADGTWTGYVACGEGNPDAWKPYYVAVDVKVEGGKVTAVSKIVGASTGDKGQKKLSWDAAENQVYLDWAIDGRTRSGKTYTGVKAQIESAIAKGKNPTSVDAVSGATYSSDAILGAYYEALGKSAEAAGSKAEKPKAPTTTKPAEPDAPTTPTTPTVPSLPSADEGEEPLVIPDGIYEGSALCRDEDAPSAYAPYYLVVEIEVIDGKVKRIGEVYGDEEGRIDPAYRYDSHENASYLNKAIKGSGLFTKGVKTQIQEKLDAGEPIEGIDTVSGATWSSLSIIEAYVKAVQAAIDAAKNAASAAQPAEPVAPIEPEGPSEPVVPVEPGDSSESTEPGSSTDAEQPSLPEAPEGLAESDVDDSADEVDAPDLS